MKVMYSKHGIKNFYLLFNMVKNEEEAKTFYKHLTKVVAKFMGNISIDYAGYIPWDSFLHKAVVRREPVTCCYPESSSSHSFKELAKYLLDQPNGRPNDGNIKFFLKRLISENMD
jgi:flagellar biosynthesis protein FlhG